MSSLLAGHRLSGAGRSFGFPRLISERNLKSTKIVSLMLAALIVSSQSSVASPVGLWQAHDGAKIRIRSCGRSLCGFIVQTNPPRDPKTGEVFTDRHNDDVTKRNRPLVGVQILISMQPTGPSKWSGQLYSDRNGKMYSGDLIELGHTTIRIEGCWLLLCGGELLRRVQGKE